MFEQPGPADYQFDIILPAEPFLYVLDLHSRF